MTATLDLFRKLSAVLDQLVMDVDSDLPLADDIHPAIHDVGAYAAGLLRLPKDLAKLEAQKATADAYIPTREKALRTANHAVTMLEGKLKKLSESIARNRQAAETEKPVEVSAVTGFAAILPATRQDYVEGLLKESQGVEADLAAARAKAKKAESNRKGAVTRAANLAVEVLAARWAIVDHEGRTEDVIKVLRKTITHLRNRQEKRDRKRAAPAAAAAIEVVDEAPKAPTDEDVLAKAAAHGITIESLDDLVAARELFLN